MQDSLPGNVKMDKPAPYRISLVIPAWNEQETIGQAIREAEVALSPLAAEHEIIVVDDGSTDRTTDVVRAEAAANPHVQLVQHPRHLGHGAALRTGSRAAALDLVAFAGTRCRFDPNELEKLLPFTARYDVTCGYVIDRQGPAYRRVLSWGYNSLVALLTGSQVRDGDCALKVFRRDQLPLILPECDDSFGSAEMLSRARLEGLTVAKVGVQQGPCGVVPAKVSPLVVIRTLSSLFRFWWSCLLFPAQSSATQPAGGFLWAGLLVLALIAGPLLFCHLSYPLLEPDEGRYAEVIRKMLTSGDWVVPTLNHQPFYDKPPLFYWLVAASFRLFGISEWAGRLVPTLAAFLTVLATFVFGRRILGARAALLGALALTLMAGFTQCGRILILDSLLTFFVVTALFTAYEAVQGKRVRWPWWVASSVCCGLGVLTKGPVALVLLAPPLTAYVWLNRDKARLTLAHWGVFVALVLVLVAPWYAAVIARDPTFAYHFFVDQHLVRFFLPAYHVEPMWYYVPVLLVGCLPWSFLLVPFARFLFSREAGLRALRPPSIGFFLLWAGWCVLFFSASSSKLPPYILPALPAVALLVGFFLDRVLFHTSVSSLLQQARRVAPRQAVVGLSALGLVISIGAWRMQLIGPGTALLQAVVCTGCMIGMTFWAGRLPSQAAWLLCGGLALGMGFVTAQEIIPAWSAQHSPLTQFEEIKEFVRNGPTAVACDGAEWGSVPFYLGRDDIVVNFGDRPQEERQEFLSRHSRVLIVVRNLVDLERFRLVMAPGMEITKVIHDGPIAVALVETVSR